MPKEAARLFLKITDIRVERLNEISDQDVLLEGLDWNPVIDDDFRGIPIRGWKNYLGGDYFVTGDGNNSPDRLSFKSLWQSINGQASWDNNPWVWVIEFEKINKPKNFLS